MQDAAAVRRRDDVGGWSGKGAGTRVITSNVFPPSSTRILAFMIVVHPAATDTIRRTALTRFIVERGTIGRCDAALCALYWLEKEGGRDEGATGHEIATLYPLHGKRRMTGMAYLLASLTRAGLAESVAKGWYRITPLGRSVVEVLPDAAMAAQLRGVRVRRASRRDQLGH